MPKKYFIPLYADHTHFLIKRCGCLVTKIYAHHTFEQSKFKKEFVIMNQVSRENIYRRSVSSYNCCKP